MKYGKTQHNQKNAYSLKKCLWLLRLPCNFQVYKTLFNILSLRYLQFFHDRGNPRENYDRNFILAELSLYSENVINNDRIYCPSTKGPHGNTDGGLWWGCKADRSICWRWEREQKRYCHEQSTIPTTSRVNYSQRLLWQQTEFGFHVAKT